MSPCVPRAAAHTALDGVLATVLKLGASCSVPELEMATPCVVPLRKSSYLDCSQVRVPSANKGAAAITDRPTRMANFCKDIIVLCLNWKTSEYQQYAPLGACNCES